MLIAIDLVVLFPFHIPLYVPTALVQGFLHLLRRLRVIPPAPKSRDNRQHGSSSIRGSKHKSLAFTTLRFPMNFMTAPLIADLFLLAILAISRDEVYGGTVGSNNINPIDIMVFFLTLAYIAISIDASGLIRYLAFRVLKWGGKVGHRLFFYLYAFFFALGSFIGNDPIILSGTAFLAYMTRVSNNIQHPRAWIHTQFAVANIASAILVSSNPTNLVLSGAFDIKFIVYSANMIVPVIVTAIVLFPCLLYIIFAHPRLIPIEITMHELPEEAKGRKPINPNIPNARNPDEWENQTADGEQQKLLSLEEIMNPFLDKKGAAFGAVIMAATLVTLLAINAKSQSSGEQPVFWVTLPAAFVMFCWDVAFGWIHRHETRDIARKGRRDLEKVRAERLVVQDPEVHGDPSEQETEDSLSVNERNSPPMKAHDGGGYRSGDSNIDDAKAVEMAEIHPIPNPQTSENPTKTEGDLFATEVLQESQRDNGTLPTVGNHRSGKDIEAATGQEDEFMSSSQHKAPRCLSTLMEDSYRWCQETFPTVTTVISHLPFALVPFALCMFVLVEALVTKGWVPVFAYGWDHWVKKTGTIGAVGGMGFLSVILCNVSWHDPSSNISSCL